MNALSIVLTSIISVLVVVIIVFIIVNALLRKVIEQKREDQEILNKYAPENPIVFLGDSLTDFYPLHEMLVSDKVVNRGIANDTTMDVEKRLKHIIALKPKTVFLQIGINDLIHSFNKLKPETLVTRIVSICEKIRACSELKVISLYPINRNRRLISKISLLRTNNLTIETANLLIKDYCLKNDIQFIDVNSALKDEKGDLKFEYTVEGLHLSYLGYEKVTDVIKKYL